MSKIIKQAKADGEPHVVKRGESPSKPAETVDGDWNSLAFSDMMAREIEIWKTRAKKEAASVREGQSRDREQAYNEGYEKGLADGVMREREERIKSMDALLKDAKNKSRNAIRNLEGNVIELAVAIAEQIIRKSIMTDPETVTEMVSEVLTHIIGSEVVTLKVSAEDYKTINSRYNTWLSMAGGVTDFKIEIDKRLTVGDFIVETDSGIIDAIISDRVGVIVDELLKINQ